MGFRGLGLWGSEFEVQGVSSFDVGAGALWIQYIGSCRDI